MSQNPLLRKLIDALFPLSGLRFLPMGGSPCTVLEVSLTRSNYVNFSTLFCDLVEVSPVYVSVLSTEKQKDSVDVDYNKLNLTDADFSFHVDMVNELRIEKPQFLLVDYALTKEYNEHRMAALQNMLYDGDQWLDQAIIVLHVEESK